MPVSLLAPQFLAFAFVRRPSLIIVQSQFLLLSRRRTFARDPRAHPSVTPQQLCIAEQVPWRRIAICTILSGRNLALVPYESGELIRPAIEHL